jgi:hypothetical protein
MICAHLKRDSEWAGLFADLFGDRPLPIKSFEARLANLEGFELPQLVYLVDLRQLPDAVVRMIAKRVAELRGGDPLLVLAWMLEGGEIPIRKEQVSSVSTDMRFFI